MKKISLLNCFLIVFFLMVSSTPSEVFAQNIFKTDPAKTGQRFGGQTMDQLNNFEDQVNNIKESQFATFVGDGIKAAQQGMQYAMMPFTLMQEGMTAAQNAIAEAKESKAYKTTMISKQITEKTTQIKTLKSEKEANISTLQEEADAQIEAIKAKIAQAQENFEIISASYKEESDGTDEGNEAVNQKIAELQQSTDLEIKQLEQEIKMIEADLKQKKKELDDSCEEQVYVAGDEIADLTMQLQELHADEEAEAKKNTDVNDFLQGAINDFGGKVSGEAVSLRDKAQQKNKKNRKNKKDVADSEDIVGSGTEKADMTAAQDAVKTSASTTVNGDSEAIKFAIDTTMAQIEGLETYLLAELAIIKNEVGHLLSQEGDRGDYEVRRDKIKAYIDVCEYTGEKGGLAGLKDTVQSAGNAVTKVQSGVANVTNKIADVQNKVGEVVSAGQQLQEAGAAIAGSVNSVSDLKSMGL